MVKSKKPLMWGSLLGVCLLSTLTIYNLQDVQFSKFSLMFQRNVRMLVTETESAAKRDEVCDYLGDDVDVDGGSVVSQADRDSWQNNQESLQSARDKNYLEDYATGESDELNDFVIQIIMFAGVFLAFAILSLLGFIFYLVCCICEPCCPPCKKCMKCCQQDESYKGIKKYWTAFGTFVGCLMMFIIAIVGLTYVSGLEDSFHTFSCAGLIAFHGISFGGGTFNGVSWLGDQLTDFKVQDLGDIITLTGTTFTGQAPAWVDVENEVMDNISTAMKLEDCNSSANFADCGKVDACTPNYTGGAVPEATFNLALGNGPSETWTSGQSCTGTTDSVAWSWPPITTYTYTENPGGGGSAESIFFGGTWETQVDAAILLYQGAVTGIKSAVDGIEAAAGTINDQTGTMEAAIDDGIAAIDEFKQQVLNQMADIADFHDGQKGIFSSITKSLTSFMYLFIFFSIFISVITALVYFREMYKLRLLLHPCWCTQSVIMIFTFLFTSVFMIISIAGEQACEIMHNALNDPVKFESYSSRMDASIRDKMKICKRELNLPTGPYQGKDDISSAFDIGDELDSIRDLREELVGFLAQDGEMQVALDLLSTVPDNLDLIIDNLELLKTEQQFSVDGNNAPDHLQLIPAITSFNGNPDSCTNNNELQMESGECSNTVGDFTLATPSSSECFLLEGDFTGHQSRYGSCPLAQTLIDDIVAWVAEKDAIVLLKREQTEALKKQLRYYIALHTQYTNNVFAFNQQVVNALDFIAHEETGILTQIHCFWFGEQLDNLYDTLCVSFVNSCYNLAFVLGWYSFTMYFSSFFIYMSVRRMGVNQKYKNKEKEIEPAKLDGEYGQVDNTHREDKQM